MATALFTDAACAGANGGAFAGGAGAISGGLYTTAHRDAKIAGKGPPAVDLRGTGSCFDATRLSLERAGGHRVVDVPAKRLPRWSRANCCYKPPAAKPDPQAFLLKGDGGGAGSATAQRVGASAHREPSPPKAGALARRANPPNSAFRRVYERGDLPLCVDHRASKNAIKWKVDLATLDYHYYLPVFLDGARERQDPVRFLAIRGAEDLLAAGGPAGRVLPVLPQLIVPLKAALNTRDRGVVAVALRLLQKLVLATPGAGPALVPYYRQLLPVLNLYRAWNLGDSIDYSQQHAESLGELVASTLALLETRGGADAFVNIKYMIPTYESCCAGAGAARVAA